MAIAVEVFDSRCNQLGEGPTATGKNNNQVQWCDIYGKAVRSKDLLTGQSSEYLADEHIGFQIPRSVGGDILGTANGPVLRDADGVIRKLPTRADVDGDNYAGVIRWNDAKVSPDGDLFLGSMAYENQSDQGALYRLSKDGKKLTKLFGSVGISNGMDWSVDKSRMFYIDTLTLRVDQFDYLNGEISNRRPLVQVTEGMGYPDGMCSDANDNLWVAFWLGSCVRCFDGKTGKQLEEIKLPTQKITSCVFAGEKLDQLIITSAVGNPGEQVDLDAFPQAGMTFIATPGVVGKKTNLFGA
ncbi:gluconolactonase [Candidatus Nanopelagicus hibericus]|jgi:gluconolactonase|uniref:Regucalcin n=1 Tax=Candidatus Nanopelagicus hibericus TaxID=1884915 RepID=A0A249K8M4_9ACTN|nr:SMP-30/gluconolactonase/LRE family protein [Candidatus Nanopelagicus hibericus]ASY13066.1 gluconolactonase [Candidatus Nanopelagicus hibericus]